MADMPSLPLVEEGKRIFAESPHVDPLTKKLWLLLFEWLEARSLSDRDIDTAARIRKLFGTAPQPMEELPCLTLRPRPSATP